MQDPVLELFGKTPAYLFGHWDSSQKQWTLRCRPTDEVGKPDRSRWIPPDLEATSPLHEATKYVISQLRHSLNPEVRAIASTPRESLDLCLDLMKVNKRGFEHTIRLSNFQLRRILRAEECRFDADPTYGGGQWDTSGIPPSEDGDIEPLIEKLAAFWHDLVSLGFEQETANNSRMPVGKIAARAGRKTGTPVDGPKLRNYRLTLKPKLTQAEFADKCGISEDAVQRGEAGKRWSDSTFEAVADTLTLLGHTVTPEDLENRTNRTN